VRPLTDSERAILEAFAERDVFSDVDVRRLNRERGTRCSAYRAMDKGLVRFLGRAGHDGYVYTTGRLWRVTVQGRKALQDGGVR